MKKILFPTDFSESTEHAAGYAAMLAKQLNAKVILLHSYPIPLPSVYDVAYEPVFSFTKLEEEGTERLNKFAKKFIQNTGLIPDHISLMVEAGMASDVIISVAKKIEADFIVMGTEGAISTIDQWIGTNAQTVVEGVECPIWIIPKGANLNFPQNIMYAADFEKNQLSIVQKIIELSRLLSTTCHIVNIIDNQGFATQINAEAGIDLLKMEFRNDDITFKILHRKDVVKGLETYIKTTKPDVLVLSLYEKSFFEKIFHTSVSKHFIYEAQLPLLILKKKA
jgi:nucleotide-binding universal stress UspA family protein